MKHAKLLASTLAGLASLFMQPAEAQVFAPNTITVVGVGIATEKPDTVAVSLHTVVEEGTVEKALQEQDKLNKIITTELSKYQIVISSSLLANARSVSLNSQRKYEIVNLISVSTSDFPSVPRLVAQLVKLDSRISMSLQWGVKDPQDLKDRSLVLASEDAKVQKAKLAGQFGLKGGDLLSVSTVNGAEMRSYADNNELPIVSGQNTEGLVVVTTKIVATFSLK